MDQQQFDDLVQLFEEAKDGSGNPLQMQHRLVKQGTNEYSHTFREHTGPVDVRSIAKTVLALILGTVIESRSNLTEDTPAWPVLGKLCEVRDPANLEKWQHVRIKHLLNHTIGFDRPPMLRSDIQNMDPAGYIDYIVNEPIIHEVGAHFQYSNAGYYLLAAYLQELLDEDLEGYARRVLFNPLGITEYQWDRYGKYLAGATRLWLLPHDLLKIGEVLLEGGCGVVSPEWVEHMKQPTALTPHADRPTNRYFRRYAYGQSLWLSNTDGVFFASGTGGQTLTIVPKHDAIVVTTAMQQDKERLEELVDRAIGLLD